MSRVSKREDVFFGYFKEFSNTILEASIAFEEIIIGYPETKGRIGELKQFETKCDVHTSTIINELHQSFITPFDREDVAAVARTMDSIVDSMEEVATRFMLFHVDEMRPNVAKLADLIHDSCVVLNEMFQHFSDFKKDPIVSKKALEVNEIEDSADEVYREALDKLYTDPQDPIEVIKWNSLLDKMEAAMDACRAVSAIVQGVIVKNG